MLKLITQVFLLFGLLVPRHVLAKQEIMGILGDSLATGAATHPSVVYDSESLWKIFRGEVVTNIDPQRLKTFVEQYQIQSDFTAPPFVWREHRQYVNGLDWVFANLFNVYSNLYLNTRQYSWGYLTASALGIPPQQILIAAENGARVEHMSYQLDKLVKHNQGKLPHKIYVMYSGNDLCAPAVEMMTNEETFTLHLKQGLDYALKLIDIQGVDNGSAFEMNIVGFLPVTQIMIDPQILAKKIQFFGETKTCQEVREIRFREDILKRGDRKLSAEANLFSTFVPPNPYQMCPTLFGNKAEVSRNVTSIANMIRAYRKIQKTITESYQLKAKAKYPQANIVFRYIDQTEKIILTPEDIAGDCFHLSIDGQVKVARAILDSKAI